MFPNRWDGLNTPGGPFAGRRVVAVICTTGAVQGPAIRVSRADRYDLWPVTWEEEIIVRAIPEEPADSGVGRKRLLCSGLPSRRRPYYQPFGS